MSKSFPIFATAILFIAFSQSNPSYLEGQREMRNYVHECTAQLFYPNNELPEVHKFENEVTQKINRNYNEGFFIWNYYNSKKVYAAILDESVNFIGDQAREYTNNQRASDLIRQELIDKISRTGELPVGIFSQFIGQPLKQKVAHLYSPTHTQSQQPIAPPMTLHPSEECCVCLLDFDGADVKQVFLSPCGHDICAVCSQEHFIERKHKTCPLCRTNIEIEKLKKTLSGI